MSEGFVRAAGVSDIGENQNKAFRIGEYDILINNTKEGFFAVENLCTHQRAELEGGKIRGCFLFCPLHGQRFSLKDGAPIGQLTDKPIRTFPLKVEGDDILVIPHPTAPESGGAQD